MPSVKQAAAEFLANQRIAVTGVSRTPKSHGSNVVYQRLRERGYAVFAVNPNAHQVEGDPCYKDLRSVPGGVEAVVIGTRPELAERVGRRHRLRPPARHHRDRRRLPADVRAHRRRRPQAHAPDLRQPRAQAGVRERTACSGGPAVVGGG